MICSRSSVVSQTLAAAVESSLTSLVSCRDVRVHDEAGRVRTVIPFVFFRRRSDNRALLGALQACHRLR
jgi:hypothetical protein